MANVNPRIRRIGEQIRRELADIIRAELHDSRLTLEFADHYIIRPSITFTMQVDYAISRFGDRGRAVVEDFEYNSGTNPHFLNVDELHSLLAEVG